MDNSLNILVVDDETINLLLLEEVIKQKGYKAICFDSPLKALDFIKNNEPDIIFVDYMMPKMDGLEFTNLVKQIYKDSIIIMVTAAGSDSALKLEALKTGVTDFLSKPIDVVDVGLRIKNISEIRIARNLLNNYNKNLQQNIQIATAKIKSGYYEMLEMLSVVSELRDSETANHVNRVSHYSRIIAKGLGLTEEEQEIIFYASALHDIGKVSIPDNILLKQGKLTEEEFEIIKTHSSNGYKILEKSDNPYLKAAAIIALTHHERYNGGGYPSGKLNDGDIPLIGRIVAVADVFDALTSNRPYKKAWTFEKAVELIESESGKQFDPKIVSVFLLFADEIKAIYKKFKV